MSRILTIVKVLLMLLFFACILTSTRQVVAQENNANELLNQLFNFAGTESDSSVPDATPRPGDNTGIPDSDYTDYNAAQVLNVRNCYRNKSIYEQISSITGIRWEFIAGIHSVETGGACDATRSIVSGRAIGAVEPDVRVCSSQDTGLGKPIPINGDCGFDNFISSGVYAGNHIKNGLQGRIPTGIRDYARASANYNGFGNRNCSDQSISAADTPPRTTYETIPGNCPPLYYGEDHPHAMNQFDEKHTPMYIVYCQDGRTCASLGRSNPVHQNLGSLTVMNILIKIEAAQVANQTNNAQ